MFSAFLFFKKVIIIKNTANALSTIIPQYERIHKISDKIITPVKTRNDIDACFPDLAETIKIAPEIAGPNNPPAAVKALAVGIEKSLLVTVE